MQKDVSIPAGLSKKILTVGLPYIDFKGGISMVINTYSRYFEVFNFLSTYKRSKNKLVTAFYFPVSLLKLGNKLLSNRDIKIIHIHGAAKGSLFRKSLVFFVAKYIFGKKVIYHSHGSELEMYYQQGNWFVKKYIKWFFERVDLIICLSDKWKIFFNTYFKVKKIVILENIVERSECIEKPAKKENEKVIFLFLGTIGYRKGLFDLLEVINTHKAYLTGKFKLVIGGRGETKKMEEYIENNQLGELVDFAGWITGDKKKELLSSSDVYILPSYNEGLPISILEAMSYRLPILSTTVGGIPEIVTNGLNGFLFAPGNKEAIFLNIKWFLENKTSIASMGNNSFKTVEPYYADVVIPRLQEEYISLLKN